MPETSHRKESASTFLRLCSEGNAEEAFSKYAKPEFKHHNTSFSEDAEGLKLAIKENALRHPQTQFEVKQVIEEGDTVVVFSHLQEKPDTPGYAMVHILRFEGSQVAEFWDVIQAIPESCPNKYGAF